MAGIRTQTQNLVSAFNKFKNQNVRVQPGFYRVAGEDKTGRKWVYSNGYVTYHDALVARGEVADGISYIWQDISYVFI